jgi:hypothetical protein
VVSDQSIIFKKRLLQLRDEITSNYRYNSKLKEAVKVGVQALIDAATKANRTNNIIQAMATIILLKDMVGNYYNVEVEHPLPSHQERLVCDLYCTRGGYATIVEVESGNIPSAHIMNKCATPEDYQEARIIGKIARYSHFADNFQLAFSSTPPLNMDLIRPIAKYFHSNIGSRDDTTIENLVKKANIFYSNPVITLEQVAGAKLDGIYSVDIRDMKIKKIRI